MLRFLIAQCLANTKAITAAMNSGDKRVNDLEINRAETGDIDLDQQV
ncbi:MAG: hypothetical protein HWE13_01070 [Gammaproteobacteria bacterium]|nr:hypothetical protein [Gammaproteobacteria bacterium]NVK86679.1 hypothetical protein [Gammaproteobacteria bacterium]